MRDVSLVLTEWFIVQYIYITLSGLFVIKILYIQIYVWFSLSTFIIISTSTYKLTAEMNETSSVWLHSQGKIRMKQDERDALWTWTLSARSGGKYRLTLWEVHSQHLLSVVRGEGWGGSKHFYFKIREGKCAVGHVQSEDHVYDLVLGLHPRTKNSFGLYSEFLHSSHLFSITCLPQRHSCSISLIIFKFLPLFQYFVNWLRVLMCAAFCSCNTFKLSVSQKPLLH